MAEAVCRKCGQPLPRRGAVCRHCGAGRLRSIAYFVVASFLIVGIVGLIGSYITTFYLNPALEQLEEEDKQPLGRPRLQCEPFLRPLVASSVETSTDVAAAAARGPIAFSDSLQTDSRPDYQIEGRAEWQEGRLTLKPRTALAKPIKTGPVAEFTVDIEFSPLEKDGQSSQTDLSFIMGRRTEVTLAVFRERANGEIKAKIALAVWQDVRKEPRAREFPLPAAPADGSWTFGYRYGLIYANHGNQRLATWSATEGPFPLYWTPIAAAVSQKAGEVTLHGLRLKASLPPPELTSEQKRQQRLLAAASRARYETRDLHDADEARAAVEANQRYCRLAKGLWGENDPRYAQGLDDLARVCKIMGEYHRAMQLLQQASEISKLTVGEEHPSYLATLHDLAFMHLGMGDYRRGLAILHQYSDGMERALGPENFLYRLSIYELGFSCQLAGDYDRALQLYRKNSELLRKAEGESQLYLLRLANIAQLQRALGDSRGAEATEQQVRDVLDRFEVLPADSPLTLSRAHLCSQVGEYERAEAILRSSADYLRKQPEKHLRSTTGQYLNELGQVYVAMNDYQRAAVAFCEAAGILEEAYGKDHVVRRSSLSGLGNVYLLEGKFSQAEPCLREALEGQRRHLERFLGIQSERQQLAAIEVFRGMFDSYVSLPPESGASALAVYQQLLAWKGVVFVRQRRTRLAGREPELAPLFGNLQTTSTRLAALFRNVPAPEDREQWLRRLETLTGQKEQLEKELAERSVSFRNQYEQEHATPSGLQEILARGTALIDFLAYTHQTGIDPTRVLSPLDISGSRKMLAFVVLPQGAIKRVDLGRVEKIQQAVDDWRTAIESRESTAERSAAQSLRRLVWDPLERLVDASQTVLISPDGPLVRAPLAALPGSSAGTRLIEERAIATIPVANLLPAYLGDDESSDRPKGKGDAPNSLLLVGDVDYDAGAGTVIVRDVLGANRPRSAVTRGDAIRFPRLPATAREIDGVQQTFQTQFPQALVTVIRDAAATEQEIRRCGSQHRYMHLATHGFFTPPEESSTPIPQQTGQLFQSAVEVSGFHPDLMSGIVLAGANRGFERTADPIHQTSDDGILTALEVAALDLDGVELAVLSACETGLGKPTSGEGVISLQRAFQLAGARTVITSLWKVDDAATQTLMTEFYRNLWEKRLGRLEALRQAQLTMMREYDPQTHTLRGPGAVTPVDPAKLAQARKMPPRQSEPVPPFYWAAFVLSGDWR